MSTLLVDELWDGIVFEQPFLITKNTSIIHIRPWIYRHGDLLTGQFQVEVLDGATVLTTAQLGFAEINSAFTENYAHGYIRFDFDSLSLRIPEGSIEKEYKLRFSMVGYTNNTEGFLGIVRQYEAKIYPTYGTGVVGNEAPNDMVEPGGLELYEMKRA